MSWQFTTDSDGNVVDKLKAAHGINLSEYSTVLDKSKLTAAQIADAERIAREIEQVTAGESLGRPSCADEARAGVAEGGRAGGTPAQQQPHCRRLLTIPLGLSCAGTAEQRVR
jgi:hypothetical protein